MERITINVGWGIDEILITCQNADSNDDVANICKEALEKDGKYTVVIECYNDGSENQEG